MGPKILNRELSCTRQEGVLHLIVTCNGKVGLKITQGTKTYCKRTMNKLCKNYKLIWLYPLGTET